MAERTPEELTELVAQPIGPFARFGEPPAHDVEGAALLLLKYEREAPLDADHATMFLQMCERPNDVLTRAAELRAVGGLI